MAVEPLIKSAHEAFARHDWDESRALFERADGESRLSAWDLDVLGQVYGWLALGSESIAAKERAFSAYSAEGNKSRAAAMALELVRDNSNMLNDATASGWLTRAARLLADVPESVEHGYLARYTSQRALARGDFDEAEKLATEALEIGMRTGDKNVQGLGLVHRGAALIHSGKVRDGLADLDEAMIAVASDELDTLTTAIVYCNAIVASRDLTDYRRAGEWTEAAKRWCSRQSLSGFSGNCRVFRAEVIRLRGAFSEAEEEANIAIEAVGDWNRIVVAGALYEIGEIKLRLGELDEAEDYFRRASEAGRDPQPGLALLRLTRGNLEAAASSIRRALVEHPHDRLGRARLLPVQTEVAVAGGDLPTAIAATDELESIAFDFGTALLKAAAGSARGLVQMAAGDAATALGSLRAALRGWQEVDAAYEVAKTRLLLAEAYDTENCPDDAKLERDAASAALLRLGVPEAAFPVTRIAAVGKPAEGRQGRAFMFTDVVSSTELIEAIGDEAWADLLAWHDQAIRAVVSEHDGEVVKHGGDGFFLAFPDVTSGVECAIAIQRRLADHRRSAGFAPRVRIGLHFSEATTRDGDYFGKGVNEAARIGAMAEGGEVLVSEASIEGMELPIGETREVSLKGIRRPVRVASLSWS